MVVRWWRDYWAAVPSIDLPDPDPTFLRELVWPLLAGAFEGFWTMLEQWPAIPCGRSARRSPSTNGISTTTA